MFEKTFPPFLCLYNIKHSNKKQHFFVYFLFFLFVFLKNR
ncbi:hypothetical protein CU019_2454 [Enterococcus faecium]|nr:hypothetical protein [Enterococcus faecium]MBK4782735.1 hypothetical protein [Enterococcus faecium]MBK4791507.1 hypothetical protein [Enterococcus faecium]MBK4799650.1 hypothetical protein [Enterococcus faecium]MBK4810230.1 hypothetical protein [Enterococcus faecium]